MEKEHTPGPWFAKPEEASDRRGIAIVALGNGWIVATITPDEDRKTDVIDWANARLIAAAPILLETLLEFIKDTEAVGPDHIAGDRPDLIETYKHSKADTAKISYWEDDPEFPSDDWKYEVTIGNTRLGYRDWVEHERDAKKQEP